MVNIFFIFNQDVIKFSKASTFVDFFVLKTGKCNRKVMSKEHCVKSVQIQSFFLPVFSRILTQYGDIWSTQWTEARPSAFLMEIWMELEMKKESRQLWIDPKTYFCLKEYLLVLVFFILQMSRKLNFSLSSIKVAIDFFFRAGLSPFQSKDVSRKKLKSPAKTICLPCQFWTVSNILPKAVRVTTVSISAWNTIAKLVEILK